MNYFSSYPIKSFPKHVINFTFFAPNFYNDIVAFNTDPPTDDILA